MISQLVSVTRTRLSSLTPSSSSSGPKKLGVGLNVKSSPTFGSLAHGDGGIYAFRHLFRFKPAGRNRVCLGPKLYRLLAIWA